MLGTLFGKAAGFLPLVAGPRVMARQPFTFGQALIVAFSLLILLLCRFERGLFCSH